MTWRRRVRTTYLPSLLSEVLPNVAQRTAEKGGLCAFLVEVDPAVSKAIEGRLAELKPVPGGQLRPN